MKQVQTKQTNLSREHNKRILILKQELQVFAETTGKENGEANKPVTFQEMNVYAINKVKNDIQSDIYRNHELYTPISGMVLANEIRKEGAMQEQKIQSEISDITLQKNQVEAKKEQTATNKRLSFIRSLIHLALVALGIIEGIYAFKAFRSKGSDMLTSFSTGIGLAIAVSLGTHYLARWCRQAENKRTKLVRLLISLFVPMMLFYVIAHIRAEGYATENQYRELLPTADRETAQGTTAWDLFFISYVFYMFGFFLSYVFAKSKEEMRREKEYNLLCDKCNELQKKEDNLRVRVKAIQNDTREKSGAALENFEQAVAAEREIISVANVVFQSYVEKNLRYRTDGIIPSFFCNPPDFQFRTFFNSLTPQPQPHEK